MKIIEIDGKKYDSIAEAAAELGVDRQELINVAHCDITLEESALSYDHGIEEIVFDGNTITCDGVVKEEDTVIESGNPISTEPLPITKTISEPARPVTETEPDDDSNKNLNDDIVQSSENDLYPREPKQVIITMKGKEYHFESQRKAGNGIDGLSNGIIRNIGLGVVDINKSTACIELGITRIQIGDKVFEMDSPVNRKKEKPMTRKRKVEVASPIPMKFELICDEIEHAKLVQFCIDELGYEQILVKREKK